MTPVGDLPHMTAASLASQAHAGGELMGGALAATQMANMVNQQQLAHAGLQRADDDAEMRVLQQLIAATDTRQIKIPVPATIRKDNVMPSRRIVQVYVADPSEAVPLANAILYTGKQHMTDLTDQELFFEIDIRTLLDHHNENRIQIIDKKVKERVEYLEPIKVRDLKMVVVTVASF